VLFATLDPFILGQKAKLTVLLDDDDISAENEIKYLPLSSKVISEPDIGKDSLFASAVYVMGVAVLAVRAMLELL